MNDRIKLLWLERLRSGGYEHGHDRLRTGYAFSSLGVLCEVHAWESGSGWRPYTTHARTTADLYSMPYAYLDASGKILPRHVMEWAGLESADPVIEGQNLSYHDEQKTLPEIADLIEAHL